MAQIIKDIEFESPSGYIWRVTVTAETHRAEPDAGYPGRWLTVETIKLTSNGREISGAAIKRILPRFHDLIVDELHEYAFDN